MPVLEMVEKANVRQVEIEEEEDWSAHNNCLHIPNAETIAAMEDVRLRRNLRGPFATVDEMMRSLQAEMDEDDDE